MNRTTLVLTLVLIGACAASGVPGTGPGRPDAAAGAREPWSLGGIVSAANPHAVDAAIDILEQGGHAVDAAIAAHAVLGLVEPQSSGLGGGAFLLVYDRAGGDLSFLDGRETAPAGATVDMFMRDGVVMDYEEAWQSGLAVGVPGTVALYAEAHERFGALPWATLFEPAIRLAERGFRVSPRLADFVERAAARTRLDENPATAAYFYPGGEPLPVGHLLRNPEYAATLRRIAAEGAGAFYAGEIPAAIARAAQAPPNGGSLTAEDIRNYEVIERPVICGAFRLLRICTTSPPSSGAAQIMIAGIYDHLVAHAATDRDRIVAFVDAQRLAYADRDHYFGDPRSVDIPLRDLLDPRYLEHRARDPAAPGAVPQHGDPGLVLRGEPIGDNLGSDRTNESAGTTHLSIIDRNGNAVSMTATIEAYFGSSRWAAGFLLNNEMTDFAREAAADGAPVANAIVPGNRPRSSMSPTMVFDADEDIVLVTGSPGGNSIPAYVAKSIIGVLDWALSAQDAVDFPNIIARGEQVRVEVGDALGQSIANDLARLGYNVREREGENSGLHVIVVGKDGLDGAADRRREGIVRKTRDRSPR